MTTLEQRQHERFQILEPTLVTATVTWQSEDGEHVLHGHVCDLSRSGVKLLLDDKVPIGTPSVLQVKTLGGWEVWTTNATACWFRPDGPVWAVGCNFEKTLPAEKLVELTARGVIDRRRDVRTPAQVSIGAKLEAGEGIVPLTLLNYSAGGFAVVSPCEMKTGERLLLLTDSAHQQGILGRVLWQRQEDGEHVVGCDFVNRDGHPTLLRFLANQRTEKTQPGKPDGRIELGIAAAVVTLMGLSIWQLLG